MEIKGTIVEIRPTEPRGTMGFQVRSFVVEVQNPRDSQYNDIFEFQVTGQRCVMLDNFSVGQFVSISFSIRGRKWSGGDSQVRYFNSLVAWSVHPVEQQNGTTDAHKSSETPIVNTDIDFSATSKDDWPF